MRDALGGWDRYEAIVKVNDAFYEGQINIMILGDGRRRFHDFTKIRDVSAALQDCNALRRDNVSDNSISKTAENSNTNKNFSLKNVDTDMTEMQRVVEENENGGTMGALEGATVENHAGIYAAQREKLAGWSDGKPRSAKAVRELLGESMTPTLEKWLHNQYEKGQNRQVKEPVRREAVEAFLQKDEALIAKNEAQSKAFWQKLRGEKVRVHEVEVGEHTHEGRGAMGRQIVQALMGDAPRVMVHNQDAQVDIYGEPGQRGKDAVLWWKQEHPH